MIRAGELRDRVTLQRFTTTLDPKWGAAPGWEAVDALWASVTPIGSKETFAQQGVSTSITHRVVIRYRADVTTKHRLIYRGSRKLDIVGVHDPDGRRRELVIDAREHPAEGSGDV